MLLQKGESVIIIRHNINNDDGNDNANNKDSHNDNENSKVSLEEGLEILSGKF